jgi:hypothetical protein
MRGSHERRLTVTSFKVLNKALSDHLKLCFVRHCPVLGDRGFVAAMMHAGLNN